MGAWSWRAAARGAADRICVGLACPPGSQPCGELNPGYGLERAASCPLDDRAMVQHEGVEPPTNRVEAGRSSTELMLPGGPPGTRTRNRCFKRAELYAI